MNVNLVDLVAEQVQSVLANKRLIIASREEVERGEAAIAELAVVTERAEKAEKEARHQGFSSDDRMRQITNLGRERDEWKARAKKAEAARTAELELLKALEELVKITEDWNASVQSVIGRPVGWVDTYLNPARAAIEKARVANHD
jgi:hypothetical protein